MAPERDRLQPEALDAGLARAVAGLRGAFHALCSERRLDPQRPQVVGRALGLDKTLAWKLCRLSRADDPVEGLAFLPGRAGLQALQRAALRARVRAPSRRRLERAIDALHAALERHVGDRPRVEQLVASRGLAPRSLLAARRQAFRANGAIWGVHARLRVGVQVVAPSALRPGFVDVASGGGLHDLQRLRPGARWPLLVYRSWGGSAAPEPVEPGDDPDAPHLLRSLSSPELPPLRSRPFHGGRLHELADGALGRGSAVTCLFGHVRRGFAPAAGPAGETAEYSMALNTPVEAALFDLLLHRSLAFELPPRFVLGSLMECGQQADPASDARYELPAAERPVELACDGDGLATPLAARHVELVERLAGALGHPLSEYRAFRVRLEFPPIPTVALLVHPLLRAGAAAQPPENTP